MMNKLVPTYKSENIILKVFPVLRSQVLFKVEFYPRKIRFKHQPCVKGFTGF